MPLPAILIAIGEGAAFAAVRFGPALSRLLPKVENTVTTGFIAGVLAGGTIAVYNNKRADFRQQELLAEQERRHHEMIAAILAQGARVADRVGDVETRVGVLGDQMRHQGTDLGAARAAIDGIRRGVDGVSGKIDKLTRQFEVGGCPAPALASFATPAGALPPGLAASSTRRAFAPLPVAFVPGLEPAF